MPKNTAQRIIDSKHTNGNGGGFVVGGGGGGGGAGVTDHGLLSGLTDDDHGQYHTDARGDARYVPLARTITAGDGLSGGGALSGNISLAVVPGEGLEIETDAIGLASSVAGAGLAYSAGVLSIGAGTLMDVSANAVSLVDGTAWQFLATNAVGTPFYRNVSAIAGEGLLATDGVLDIGAGVGITVNANTVALTTPGTLTVSTINSSTGNHVHAIDSSSDPNATSSILATTAAGLLTLRNGAFRQAAQSQAVFASGFAGSGWRVDYGITEAGKASAEFDNLTVRGTMRVYELLIQQIRATNGSLFVSSASKVVAVFSVVNPFWAVNSETLTFNGADAYFTTTIYQINTAADGDAGRELYHGFLYGDIIRAQQVQWDGSSYSLVMQSNLEVTGVTDLFNYQATFVSGTAPAAGFDFVRLGSSSNANRRGSVYLTADDSNAPFIDIIDDVRSHADWNTPGKIKARYGRLSGISDVDFGGALSGYGLYGNNVFLKGRIVVTGGSLGGLAAADVNSNTTTIDGGHITAQSVTANQIAANTITATQITAGTITANEIAAGTITADKLSVTTLSAISADLGSVTAGQIVVGSTNKLWLNDSADGGLAIGGATKASAPFRVSATGATYIGSATRYFQFDGTNVFWKGTNTELTSAGVFTASSAQIGDLTVDANNIYINAPASYNITTAGYKFKYGASVAAGLTAWYSAGTTSKMYIDNNANESGTAQLYSISSETYLRSFAGGSGKTSVSVISALHAGDVANSTTIALTHDGTNRTIAIAGTALTFNGNAIWHAGNDGSGSTLDADTLDGVQGNLYALLASPTFTGTPTADTFRINVNASTTTGSNYIDIGRWRNVTNSTGVGTPAANTVRLFFWMNASNKGRIGVVWPSGTVDNALWQEA